MKVLGEFLLLRKLKEFFSAEWIQNLSKFFVTEFCLKAKLEINM